MEVLVTGATGYVGSAVADGLLAAGWEVAGLARSESSAEKLKERGITPRMGDIKDGESVEAAIGAGDTHAVVHAATTHGPDAEEGDRTVAGAVFRALGGTNAAFIYTSGCWVMGDTPRKGPPADEESPVEPVEMLAWRPAVERDILQGDNGVRPVVVRPALVYGRGGGVIGELVDTARERGAARVVQKPGLAPGENHWTLVHLDDLGRFYARILEEMLVPKAGAVPGGTLLISATTEPIPVRHIAEAAGRAAGAGGDIEPWSFETARQELGPYADALALDQRLSAAKARRLLDWTPQAPSVFEELETGSYASRNP